MFSSGDEHNGYDDDDELPRMKQSMDVWFPPPSRIFLDQLCAGGWSVLLLRVGQLDKHMPRTALPTNAKSTIEKLGNDFNLESMKALGEVNKLVCWAKTSDAIL